MTLSLKGALPLLGAIPPMDLEVHTTELFRGRGALRPFGYHYSATLSDGWTTSTSSKSELEQALTSHLVDVGVPYPEAHKRATKAMKFPAQFGRHKGTLGLKGLPMPSYWTPKQERQYKHIKTSCVKRKCRRVKGKKQCVRTCTRMAAATTNKFRGRGLGATPKKLSKRLAMTLKDAASSYQGKQLGTNVLNNNLAAYELEKRGLVEIRGGWAFATPAGQAALRTGFGGLRGVRGRCCVMRGKKQLACFYSRKAAITFSRRANKTHGPKVRIACD